MSDPKFTAFVRELLSPQTGWIAVEEGVGRIEVPLCPIVVTAALAEAAGLVACRDETSLRLEDVLLGAADPFSDLPGRTFTFPRNPHDGFIDGSLYFGGVHNPVDVDLISFGDAAGGFLRATMEGTIDFAFEGPEALGTHLFRVDVVLGEPAQKPVTDDDPSDLIRSLLAEHEEMDALQYEGCRSGGDEALASLGIAGWRGMCREAVRRFERGELSLPAAQALLGGWIGEMAQRFPEYAESVDYLRAGAEPLLRMAEGAGAGDRAAALAAFWSLHPNR